MTIEMVQREGGYRIKIEAHAILWPNGIIWDEVNGFTYERGREKGGVKHVVMLAASDGIADAIKRSDPMNVIEIVEP